MYLKFFGRGEEHWYTLKWNYKILFLMSQLHKEEKVKNLAKHGFIESLAGRTIKFRYICESGFLTLVFRRHLNWDDGLEGECRSGHEQIVFFNF